MKSTLFLMVLLIGISISPASAAVNHYTQSNGAYTIEIFNGSGSTTFTFPANANPADYLIVAGGGAGGGKSAGNAGGGGAGGFVNGTSYNLLPGGTYTINVGAGGLTQTSDHGLNGGSSWIMNGTVNLSATGGGGGGIYTGTGGANNNGWNGGSGGGTSQTSTVYPTEGSGIAGQGYNGGKSLAGYTWSGAGGGGADELGGNPYGANGAYGGKGGKGLSTSIMGYPVYYAGGGSGSSNAAGGNTNGMGGAGGGGNGRYGTTQATAGTDGLGGGGGGGGETSYDGKNGGSGIIIIRYSLTPPVAGFSILLWDNSTGAASYQWNATNLLGNNTPVTFSTSQFPGPILFSPGNYLITQTVTNPSGSDSTSKTLGINLTMPVVHFWNRTA